MRRKFRSDAFIGTIEKFLGIGNAICHLTGRNVRSDCSLRTFRRKSR